MISPSLVSPSPLINASFINVSSMPANNSTIHPLSLKQITSSVSLTINYTSISINVNNSYLPLSSIPFNTFYLSKKYSAILKIYSLFIPNPLSILTVPSLVSALYNYYMNLSIHPHQLLPNNQTKNLFTLILYSFHSTLFSLYNSPFVLRHSRLRFHFRFLFCLHH